MKPNKPDIAQLKRYLNGELTNREMHVLERQVQEDPMLMDILMGMEFGNSEMHEVNVQDVRQRILQRTGKGKQASLLTWRTWSVAASVLLVLFIGGFWLFQPSEKERLQVSQIEEPAKSAIKPQPDESTPTATPQLPSPKRPAPIAPDEPKSSITARSKRSRQTIVARSDTFMRDSNAQLLAGHTEGLAISRSTPKERKMVRGLVIDRQSRTPLAGAMVMEKGKDQKVVSTDSNGRFNIPVEQHLDTLRFTSIGFQEEQLSLHNSRDTLLVALEPSHDELNEIVVTPNAEKLKRAEPIAGWEAYAQYLKQRASLVEGQKQKVKVAFHLNEEGHPVQFEVLKGGSELLNRQAIALIRNGGKWRLGKAGTAERVVMMITFEQKRQK